MFSKHKVDENDNPIKYKVKTHVIGLRLIQNFIIVKSIQYNEKTISLVLILAVLFNFLRFFNLNLLFEPGTRLGSFDPL
jgi:hypothetical protein